MEYPAITAFKCISKFPYLGFLGALLIILECRLRPDWLYAYTERDWNRWFMLLYHIANLVTVTQINMIYEMPCTCWTLTSTTVRIWYQASSRAVLRSQLPWKSPTDMHSSPSLKRDICVPILTPGTEYSPHSAPTIQATYLYSSTKHRSIQWFNFVIITFQNLV